MIDRRHEAGAEELRFRVAWRVAAPQTQKHGRERDPADGFIERHTTDEDPALGRRGQPA
jgi:hypothetical protein